jgi:hypothetical protein
MPEGIARCSLPAPLDRHDPSFRRGFNPNRIGLFNEKTFALESIPWGFS